MAARRIRPSVALGLAAALVGALVVGLAPELWAEEPDDRVERARREAAAREARAQDYRQEAAAVLAELEAIDREIVASRRSERAVKKRQRRQEQELEVAQADLSSVEEVKARKQDQMSTRLVSLYKDRVVTGVPWLYSTQDIQTRLRTASALQQVLAADLRQFAELRRLRDDAATKAEQLRTRMVELEGTEAEFLRTKQQKAKKLIERRNLIDLLRTRADRELRAAGELREAAARLEEEIQKGRTLPQGTGLTRRRVPKPVRGTIRQGFGRRVAPEFSTVTQRMGIEFDASVGTPVQAVGPGRVLFAGWFRGYGQVVIVDHGRGSVSVSGYLEELAVEPDDVVLQGQVIGSVGETGSLSGPGLYFELRKDGQPVDPESWFQK